MANLWYSWLVTHGFAWFIVGHDILSARVVKTGLLSNPHPPNVQGDEHDVLGVSLLLFQLQQDKWTYTSTLLYKHATTCKLRTMYKYIGHIHKYTDV